MTVPGKYDLALYRGDCDDWTFALFTDPEGTVLDDLTGVTVKAEFRDESGGTVIMTFDTEVVLPNLINMNITTDMWVGAARNGVWDLQLTYPDGCVKTVLAGRVQVTADVTDSDVFTALEVTTPRVRSVQGRRAS